MRKKKKCEACNEHELTPQELEYKDGTRCYYCIRTTHIDMAKIMQSRGQSFEIPKAETFGRAPAATATLGDAPLEENIKQLPQTHKFQDFGSAERAEFFAKYGFDPQPPSPPTIISVLGENEDTYIKISLGAPANITNPEILGRLEDLARATLDTICQIATFGPMNPRATLEKLGPSPNQPPQSPFS